MNSPQFLTHHKGVPLRAMSRDDVMEVAQYYYRLYHNAMEERKNELHRRGQALVDVYEHRSLSGG